MIKTPDLSDEDFKRFKSLIYNKCGICLNEGKKELVRARLNKRLRSTGIPSFNDYYNYLTKEDDGDELVVMLDAISTNKTSFFREIKHFNFLNETVFPRYAAGEYGKRLRFWSAACSSGQEPYTLAISLLEYLGKNSNYDIKILATDISTKVLSLAQRGIYQTEHIEDIPKPLIRTYFQQGQGRQKGFYRVKPILRDVISFKRFNLMDKFNFKGSFQFVFCRNVMIYFDKKTQEKLVNKFHQCIVPGGYLMIGHSESLTGVKHPFKYIQPSIYQKA